jgi:hypothetical protein
MYHTYIKLFLVFFSFIHIIPLPFSALKFIKRLLFLKNLFKRKTLFHDALTYNDISMTVEEMNMQRMRQVITETGKVSYHARAFDQFLFI